MPTAGAPAALRAPHAPPRSSSSTLQRSKAGTIQSSSTGVSPLSVDETPTSRPGKGGVRQSPSLRSSQRGSSRASTARPNASATDPPPSHRRGTAIHIESSGSGSVSSPDGNRSRTLRPNEKQVGGGGRPKSAARSRGNSEKTPAAKGAAASMKALATLSASASATGNGTRTKSVVPIREFVPDDRTSTPLAAAASRAGEEEEASARQRNSSAQGNNHPHSTMTTPPLTRQHSGEGRLGSSGEEERRSPFVIPPPSSRRGFSATTGSPSADLWKSGSGSGSGSAGDGIMSPYRLGTAGNASGYRYPAPPPVCDQLYVSEEAAVQLCGLPNLTLSMRSHYAASPFLYTPGGSDPNHTSHLRYPSDAQRTETNTAAGKFQAPIVGDAQRRRIGGGSPNTTLVLIQKDMGPPPSLPLPEDSAGPTSSVPGIVGVTHRVSTAPVSTMMTADGAAGRLHTATTLPHPMSRSGSRGGGGSRAGARDYGPSVTLGSERRVSLRGRSSGLGLDPDGLTSCDDPRQKTPISQQLKWRFLTAAAVSLSASTTREERMEGSHRVSRSPLELLHTTATTTTTDRAKRARSTTPQRYLGVGDTDTSNEEAARYRRDGNDHYQDEDAAEEDAGGVVFHNKDDSSGTAAATEAQAVVGGEEKEEHDEMMMMMMGEGAKEGMGQIRQRPYTSIPLDSPEAIQSSRRLLLLYPHATLGASPTATTSSFWKNHSNNNTGGLVSSGAGGSSYGLGGGIKKVSPPPEPVTEEEEEENNNNNNNNMGMGMRGGSAAAAGRRRRDNWRRRRLSAVEQPSLSTTMNEVVVDDEDDMDDEDMDDEEDPISGPHVLTKTAIATPLGKFPLQPSEQLPTGPGDVRPTPSAGSAFAPMQLQSSSDSAYSAPPLPYVPTAEGHAISSTGVASPVTPTTTESSPLPITAYATSTPPVFLTRPLPPFPAELPVHMLSAIEQAKRTMTFNGNLRPRTSPRSRSGAERAGGAAAGDPLGVESSSSVLRLTASDVSAEGNRGEDTKGCRSTASGSAAAAAAFHTSTFSLTLPQNQFRSAAERRSGRGRGATETMSRRSSTSTTHSSATGEVVCGHTQRRQQKEAQLNARISQLREEVLQPQSVIEEDQPLPPTANELHITRAMHNEDVDARPLEAEVQFLWKESEIRPQPLMVAPSPMDRIAPPQSNRMLLQHSEVSQPPYAAAEAAKLTAQRHQMSRMEFEEKIQPFRVAKTLLTNTNARHLALLDVQEKRKEREQWLVQRIGAFYPENEEEEEDPADPGATAASGSGSGNERPLPDEDPAGLAQEASQSTSSRGAITSPNVAGSGASTSAPPFRIPKHFPASFRALLEDLHPPSTPESTSRLSRHHRHRHSPHANSHSHSRSRSGGAGPLGSSSSGQLRSISSRAHFPPRFRPGGFGLDGPTIIHHPHLDRLRTALMALTEQEVDAILRPPGWEEFEKQHPKRRSNASPPLRPMSPETPISLRRSQSSQAFEQYRRSLLPSPAASVHGGAGGTAVSEETVDAAVSPEKRRLDEISILFLHLLEEAADAANYGPEERERIIDIHAAFQEQRLQQEYQNYHPVLDVVVSAAFDEQWELEVERHKTEKDRKLEAGIAAASSQQKKVCASAKHNAGAAAGGGKGSHSAGKAKTASRTAGKRGDATSTRPSEADSDSAQAATLAALANASPSLEAFGGFNVNPLFPLDKAWIREIERIRQHDALLDLLRQRPVCPADELPPGLGTEVTGGMQPIASRGSFTNSATSGGIANAIAGGHGGHTGPSPVPGGDASDLPPTSIVTFPQAEMGMLVNPSSSDHAAAAATGTTQRRRSTASPDTVKASVGQAGAAGPAVRKSSISINESMNIVLGDSKEQSAADEERVGRGSISNSSAASGGAAESTSHEANDETQQPQRSAESGAGEVGEDGNQEAEAEAGAQAPSSAPPRSSMASSSDTPHTATAGGSANSQTSGVSPSPEDDEAAGRRGSNTKVGRSVPPPLQLSSPSVVLPANEQELMHHTQLQQSAQQQMLLASSTSMSTYNTSTLNAGVPLMNQTTFNADDAWGSIRDMGMAVPLDIHAPHMELLLDYHESAVAEMELIMEAEERSVTNLLQQL